MLTVTILLLLALVIGWIFYRKRSSEHVRRSVAILVLGDIGRSPRMMYHAESFANARFHTHLIGYRGSKPIPSLRDIQFLYLSEPPVFPNLPFVLLAPFKVAHQITTILVALTLRIPHPPQFILVQNPPSIPTLALVWIVGRIRGCKVIIDWHNLGYSILAMKLGKGHPFVRLSERFERTFGRSAYAHLFVTHAMRDYLVREWDLKGHKAVLHDRPPQHFHKASPPEIHELFLRIRECLPASLYSSFFPPSSSPYCTPFTHIKTSTSSQPTESTPILSTTSSPPTFPHLDMPTLRPDRPALLVSSTSWTPDEDFGILLHALCLYEKRARREIRAGGFLPKILVVITGKGPLREKYMREVDRLQYCGGDDGDGDGEGEGEGGGGGWKWVRCINMWLEAEDYPLLLGSADLGVCLHSSSSGMDLPMKVVDMFGCGLPVCALDFACLDELVKDGKNGLVFKDAAQLAQQLESLLSSFPESASLGTLRSSLVRNSLQASSSSSSYEDKGDYLEWNTWGENWEKIVRPLLD